MLSSRVLLVPLCSACHFPPGSLAREAVGGGDGQHRVPEEAGAGDSSYTEPLRGTRPGQVTFLGPLNTSFLLCRL